MDLEIVSRKLKPDEPNDTTSKSIVIIRLLAPLPLPGQHVLYDNMTASGMSPRQAILGIFRREFDQVIGHIIAEEETSEFKDLETDGNPCETTRTISAEQLNKLKTVFDPFGTLTKRALGLRLGLAVLSVTADLEK